MREENVTGPRNVVLRFLMVMGVIVGLFGGTQLQACPDASDRLRSEENRRGVVT